MSAEVETMFSAKQTPWHKLGIVTADVLTAQEAVETAGLDWEVQLKKLNFQSGSEQEFDFKSEVLKAPLTTVPDKYCVVRSKDEAIYGVVGSRYTPVQNTEAFTFMDNLVDSGEAKYETAGSLYGGSTIFILMKMDKVLPINDEVNPYLLLVNTHDGSSSLKVMMTPIRVVCANTLTMAVGSSKKESTFSVRHTSGIHGKLDEGRRILGLAERFYDDFSAEVNQMLEEEVNTEIFNKVMEQINPEPIWEIYDTADENPNQERESGRYDRALKKHKEIKGTIQGLYLEEAESMGNNAWSLLNAWNSYELWHKRYRGANTMDKRLEKQAIDVIWNTNSMTSKAKEVLING